MERKEISSKYGILVIFLFCIACFLVDYTIIGRKVNSDVFVSTSVVSEKADEAIDSYKKDKNIKIDYNRDYVYSAGYHNDNKYKEYDYCNGESTYTNDGFDVIKCDKGSMRLSNLIVPYINIKSNDAYYVNRELKDLYEEYAARFDDFYVGLESGNGGSEILSYYSFSSNDILSVVVIYGYQMTDILYPDYKVYNFDLRSGDLIDYDDMINLLGVDTDLIYSNVFSNISDSDFPIFYDETIIGFKESISNGSVKWFINDDGVLEYIVDVFVPAGRGNVYHRYSSQKVMNSEDN